MAKDLDLILELAADSGARMPRARTNLDEVREAIAAGFGQGDSSTLAEFLRRPSG